MNEIDLKHRIKNAIKILAVNKPFKVGELTFDSKSDSDFIVIGLTSKNSIENLTREIALNELEETKILFSKMLNLSSELFSFTQKRKITYVLSFDYGMGSLEICSEINSKLKWTTELS